MDKAGGRYPQSAGTWELEVGFAGDWGLSRILEMLSWDVPTYKARFVSFSKDRTLGQSRPSLTEIQFLTFLALQIRTAWRFRGGARQAWCPRRPPELSCSHSIVLGK